MNDRPCKDCIWLSADGCTRWECEPKLREDVVAEAMDGVRRNPDALGPDHED